MQTIYENVLGEHLHKVWREKGRFLPSIENAGLRPKDKVGLGRVGGVLIWSKGNNICKGQVAREHSALEKVIIFSLVSTENGK